MSRIGRSLAILAIVLGGALVLPRGAAAHALLQSSMPAAGSTVGTAPTTIELIFGETPDPRLSTVKVLDASGTNHANGAAAPAPGNGLELDVPVGPLTDGVYTVAWRTVSSVDGHVAAGSFAFGVGVAVTATPAPGEAAGGTSPSASLPADAARWLLYLGLVAVFGAAFIGLAVDPEAPRSVLRMAAAGWVVAAIGAVSVTAVQWSDTGGDVGTLLGTSVGTSAIERLAAIAITGVLTALLVRQRSPVDRRLFGLVVLAAASSMFVDVATGHAAAGSLAPLQVVAEWLHIASVGLWIGGLAALLLDLRGQPSEAKAAIARRYSQWAGTALAVVAVTGIVRAVSEILTLDALVSTDYGRVVLIKSALLGVVALLGASNRYFNVPKAAQRLTGLRRAGAAEVMIGAGILALSGLLVNLTPPASVASAASTTPAAPPIIVSGHDFGTSVKVRLVVTPGAAGLNEFSASLTDFDTGAPAPATSVSLRFAIASRTGVGESTLALQPGAAGSFSAAGGNLSLDGIWKVTATVAEPTGTVEVPLVVATSVVPEASAGDASPLSPSTVLLINGLSVQVYLDPDTAGPNELHATFFTATGKELPVQTATMAVWAQDGSSSIIAPRQLEPGHFVADYTLASGPLTVDIVGDDPSGGVLHAHLLIANP
jgi:copper transport protein